MTLIDSLRSDLRSAGYTVAAVSALWGEEAAAALHRGQRVPAVRALDSAEDSPLATLARMFLLGLDSDPDAVGRALPSLGVEGATALGLAATVPGGIRARRDLRPYAFVDSTGEGSWWIVSDLGELALGHALGEDHVLGVGGASLTLSGLMLQRPVSRVLDLGTGCGIQAMHAARHAEHVVATDISRRALEIARLNAELNGIGNIEFRHGSLFEPVAGERFDQIVSNPPFVITPRRPGVPEYEYRDGGMVGDELVRAVIAGCATHLEPGGTAQMLGNWEYHSDAAGLDRARGWVTALEAERTPLDAWLIEREVQSPEEYAETWIRDGGTRAGSAAFDELYDAWLADFEARDVRAVGFGYVILRRPVTPEAPRWNLFERLHTATGENETGLGVHIAACIDARDREAALSDAELAASALMRAADVTEERHYWPGSDDPQAMLLHQGGGFGRTVPLDTALAALLGACDGELPLGVLVAAIAQLLEVDESALAAQLLPRVRELIGTGMLLFAV
ncbi:Methyltransferase small domain-containing protein [Paramicrobacterium humi]|uniref:Methyltransferase small domain-containing protein n=1 Tax=Paramicrobacterium humi TaxID=640635 RepID=A0A1H4KIA6_9MICO|nr:methyltransferase [Microbacterium humi]SEB57652.1 Methyltransferase small domain-containing protein [Microbacterium humi]